MVINFFGRRGCGKTTTIRGNLKYCRPPVLIIDILGNFHEEQFIQCDSIPDALGELEAWASDEKKTFQKGTPIIVLKSSNPATAADYLAAGIWELETGTLVLDEVDSIRFKEGSCFDEYIRYGRNHNGDLITGCRRPAELDRSISAAANKFYCFQTHEPRDLEYFESIFGDRAYELAKLPKFTGLWIDHDISHTGEFKIDVAGNIFHTSDNPV